MDVLFGKPLIQCFKSVITNAESELVIISPYIDFKIEYQETIKIPRISNLKVKVIYSGKEDAMENWINYFDLEGIILQVLYMEDLHSKVYLNEKRGLITSKNLYEKDSGIHNEEIGVSFDQKDKGYKNIVKYISRIEEKAKKKEKIVKWV